MKTLYNLKTEQMRELSRKRKYKELGEKRIQALYNKLRLNSNSKIRTYRVHRDRDHYVGSEVSFTFKQEKHDFRYEAYLLNLYHKEIASDELSDYELAKEIYNDLFFNRREIYWKVKKYDLQAIIRRERRKLAKRKKKDTDEAEQNEAKKDLSAIIEEHYLSYMSLKDKSDTSAFGYIKARMKDELKDYTADEANTLLEEQIKRVDCNYYARRRRFIRKFYMLRPNYFITFTYDSEKMDEQTFVRKLRRCLVNLAERRDWLCIIVPEKGGEGGRKHFHVVARIPKGQMIGELYERNDWSTKHKRRVRTVSNTFFERTFGRCDFKEIKHFEVHCGQVVSYLLKYLSKDNERVMYSRGIPTDIILDLSEDDVAVQFIDGSNRIVFWDDVFKRPFEELCLHLKLGKLDDL